MGKAILIINMPNSCYQCQFHIVDNMYSFENVDTCEAYCNVIPEDQMKTKPKWCPLKPLPPKREYADESRVYKAGWNDCLNEILGEDK